MRESGCGCRSSEPSRDVVLGLLLARVGEDLGRRCHFDEESGPLGCGRINREERGSVGHSGGILGKRTVAGEVVYANYGRREIAPRNLAAADICQANEEARARAKTERERTLIGLHPPGFYDG